MRRFFIVMAIGLFASTLAAGTHRAVSPGKGSVAGAAWVQRAPQAAGVLAPNAEGTYDGVPNRPIVLLETNYYTFLSGEPLQVRVTTDPNGYSGAVSTQAHIHRGTGAVAGPVVVNFNPTFIGGTASGSVAGVDQALINEILGNPSGFYVNVHNADFPNGAVRGQLAGAGTGEGARTLIVPVVGKVAGAAGTNFVTDLRIINQGTTTANVTLDFFQQNGAGQTAPTATLAVTVAPGEQKVMDDVIAALSTSGLGGPRVTSNQDVIVTSRVINDLRASGQGTNGFAIDATPLANAVTAATVSFLSQASTADINTGTGFRTNIGYFNPSSSAVTATFTAHRSSDGVVLGSRTITIPGFSFVQQGAFSLINTVAAADQVQANFYVTWTSTAPLFVYGAVTDNKTGDAVLIQ